MNALLLPLLATMLGAAPTGVSVEYAASRNWIESAWRGQPRTPVPMGVGLNVLRQDHGQLELNRSVLKNPLAIGSKKYEHGLGSHSVSEIVVHLEQPAATFDAEIGIDKNSDTAGQRGSVVFVVELAGKEIYRSDICRGGEEPRVLHLDMGGVREFTLRIFDAGDGPGWDQSDWANAVVTGKDGSKIFLDDMPIHKPGVELSVEPPFSFVYDGKSSSQQLTTWKKAATSRPAVEVGYVDERTGLEVVAELREFEDFPAVEWTLHLRNTGKQDTPVIENVLPLDLKIAAPPQDRVVLHRSLGSTCAPTDFLPQDDDVAPKADIRLSPNGGRSSDGNLPFFNLEWSGGGLVTAIGWTGQWAMRLQRSEDGKLALQAGQQQTRFRLRPGESVRTPSILLVFWNGSDRYHGHNLLRQLLLKHYTPRIDGEVAVPPVTQNTWYTYNGNGVTEQNQLEAIRQMAPLGVEGYWLDAGWFEVGWPAGVGNWFPQKKGFPNGLKCLGDAAHQRGMKFILWFEPERVAPGSQIAREHPEWVLHAGDGDGLFNLADPAAREWLTNHLVKCVTDWGVDVYRNDFNIDPLRFWQKADAPDRQGITEIRYIEGLYTMWDAIRSRCPGVVIDNCASGGRRIDLEMIRRSIPFWRSDTQCCGRAMPTQDQVQTAGLNLWTPLHTGGVWAFDAYSWRSIATTGGHLCMNMPTKDSDREAAQRLIAETKNVRPLWLGDYYPLLPITLDERHWCGWQFDRADLGKGFAMLFRRPESPYSVAAVDLRGIDPDASYRVSFPDAGQTRTMSGRELARLRMEIETAPGSVLMTYEKQSR